MRTENKFRVAIGLLLAVAVVSGGILGGYFFSLARAGGELEYLAETFHAQPAQTESTPGLASLYAQNKHLAGWLTIAGTSIDYPVMHTPEDPEYYLRRSFTGQYSVSGMLFIDGSCSLDPRSDNIIIHGHNMQNGTMFADLLLYADQDFWQAHPQLKWYTLDEGQSLTSQTYDIIAAIRTQVYNDRLAFQYHDFINASNEEEFTAYLAGAKQATLYQTGLTAHYGDDLLTLATCSYHTTNGRFVILARLASEES